MASGILQTMIIAGGGAPPGMPTGFGGGGGAGLGLPSQPLLGGGAGSGGYPFGVGSGYPFGSYFPGVPGFNSLGGMPGVPSVGPILNAMQQAAANGTTLIQNASGGNASGGPGGNASGAAGGVGGAGGAGGVGGNGGVNIAGGGTTTVVGGTVVGAPAASASAPVTSGDTSASPAAGPTGSSSGTTTIPGTTIQVPTQTVKNQKWSKQRNNPATVQTAPTTATGATPQQQWQSQMQKSQSQRQGRSGFQHGNMRQVQQKPAAPAAPTTAHGKYAVARFSRACDCENTYDDVVLERHAIRRPRQPCNYPGPSSYERAPVLLTDEFPFIHGYGFRPFEQVYIRIRLALYGDEEMDENPHMLHDGRVAVTDHDGSFVTLFEVDMNQAYNAAGLIQAHGRHSDKVARQRVEL
jgi:hypothetical protein